MGGEAVAEEEVSEETSVEEEPSLKDKIVGFFHKSDAEGEEIVDPQVDESAEEENIEIQIEPEVEVATIEEEVLVIEAETETEASAEEEIIEESTSIKDKIVEFFHTSEEPEIKVEPEVVEESVEPETAAEENNVEDTPEEATLTEEIGAIEETVDADAELEGSCEDLPEDKTLREKIWNFFGCGDKEATPVEELVETEEVVEETEESTTEAEEVVEVADDIPAENSIKEAVQSFLGINEENAEEPIVSADQATEDPATEDLATEETQTVEEEVIASDESGKQQM